MGPLMVTLSGSVVSSPFTVLVVLDEVLVDFVLVGRLAESVTSLWSIAFGSSAVTYGTIDANSKRRCDSDGMIEL